MKPPRTPAALALSQIEEELAGRPVPALPPGDLAVLADAAGADPRRLKRWIKRRIAGEPLAHITGSFTFRGLKFAVDKRAYVTDPELTHLVDAVLGRARAFQETAGRPPLLADFGVGCGSLALAIKDALPDAEIVGLDIDPDALAVAAANAAARGAALRLIESDLFDDWPQELPAPDFIYGDPPWGDETTLYAGDRPAVHYGAMPAVSAFPLGGRTGVHAQILRAVARRGWASEIWLNGGVLPREELAAVAQNAADWEVLSPAAGVRLLRCRMVPPPSLPAK
jgi:release factor glutamine methyltransferase